MKVTRNWIQVACIVLLVSFAISCNALALGGDKKYKVDLSNILLTIQKQIENDGEVSDKMETKLTKYMEKSKEEFGGKGSWIWAEKAMNHIVEAKTNPGQAFMLYQTAKMEIAECFDMLKTEVQD